MYPRVKAKLTEIFLSKCPHFNALYSETTELSNTTELVISKNIYKWLKGSVQVYDSLSLKILGLEIKHFGFRSFKEINKYRHVFLTSPEVQEPWGV